MPLSLGRRDANIKGTNESEGTPAGKQYGKEGTARKSHPKQRIDDSHQEGCGNTQSARDTPRMIAAVVKMSFAEGTEGPEEQSLDNSRPRHRFLGWGVNRDRDRR
jgi:hypothetical protein